MSRIRGEAKEWESEHYMLSEQLSYAERTIADLNDSVRKLDQENTSLKKNLKEVSLWTTIRKLFLIVFFFI